MADHDGKVTATKFDGLTKFCYIVRAVFDADDVLVLAQPRGRIRLDLIPSQIGHAVQDDGDAGSVSGCGVMINQSFLGDRRSIVVRRDDQYGFRAGLGRAIDFSDRAARALLSCADDERESLRNSSSGSFDRCQEFTLVEIDALAG